MTDPPFLTFWASKLIGSQKWFLWAMDLFPEAFIASNLVSAQNSFYQYFFKKKYSTPPNYLIALGELQAAYIQTNYNSNIRTTVLPCGIHNSCTLGLTVPEWKKEDNKIYLGYCGNIGAAHSVNFVKEVISGSAGGNYKFILSVYGEKAEELKKYALRFDHVITLEHVSKENLRCIDVHLVTLKREWVHICVPSKAVSAICSNATIMFCGTKQCDTWKLLGKAGWFVNEKKLNKDVKQQLAQMNSQTIQQKRNEAKRLKEKLIKMKDESYKRITNEILKEKS